MLLRQKKTTYVLELYVTTSVNVCEFALGNVIVNAVVPGEAFASTVNMIVAVPAVTVGVVCVTPARPPVTVRLCPSGMLTVVIFTVPEPPGASVNVVSSREI